MKVTTITFSLILMLSACANVNSTPNASKYTSLGTTSLWLEYASTDSAIELAFIEAELGLRGEREFAGSYLGQRTSSAYQRKIYSRTTSEFTSPNQPQNDRDCGDFASSAEAQQFFLKSGGPISDPSNLDADGDGLACEWGVRISRTSQEVRTSQRAARARATFRSRCYRGPRGGTYTLTASGRRNYDGC